MKIVLISGKARHGKTSTAIIAEKHIKRMGLNALHINFADYVKFICRKYFGWDGKKDERGRNILQHVGTDIIRARDENFWVDMVIRFAQATQTDYDVMLIGDWRFPNEYTRWLKSGMDEVIRVRVYRPGYDNGLTAEQNAHLSEVALDDFPMDYRLYAVDLTELETESHKILDRLKS